MNEGAKGLRSKHIGNSLGHIPAIFVITRADEFKIDQNSHLSKENIDSRKRDEFAASFVARVKAANCGLRPKATDLIFIDNKSGFGVDELKDFLVSGEVDLTLTHANTIYFFQRRFREIFDELYKWADSIKNDLSELLSNASINRNEFEMSSNLNEDKFSKLCAGSHEELSKRLLEDLSTLNSSLDNKELDRPILLNPVKHAKILEQLRNELISKLASVSEREIFLCTKDNFRVSLDLYAAALDWRTFNLVLNSERADSQIELLQRNAEATSNRILTDFIEQWIRESAKLRALIDEWSEELRELERFVRAEASSRSEKARNERYSELLAGALDTYGSVVQMYRTAVLAYRGRRLTAQISLEEALDEFDSINLDKSKLEAIRSDYMESVFPKRAKELNQYDEHQKAFRDKILLNIEELKSVLSNAWSAADNTPSVDTLEKAISPSTKLAGSLENFEKFIRHEAQIQSDKVAQQAQLAIDARKGESSAEFKRALRRYYGFIAAIFLLTLVVVGTSLFIFALNMISQSVGLIAGYAISFVISIGSGWFASKIAMLLKKKPDAAKNSKIQSNLVPELQALNDEIDVTIDESQTENLILDSEISEFGSTLERIWATEITKIEKCIEKIAKVVANHNDALRAFAAQHDAHVSKLIAWYDFTEEKETALRNMSKNIKAEAIEPSFAMLSSKEKAVEECCEKLSAYGAL